MRMSSRRRSRAQSLIEFGASLPVLLLLFLGALDINTFVGDLQTAVTATRQAARLASILGNQACSSPALSWLDTDQAIVNNVTTVGSAMNSVILNNIVIYRPDDPSGNGKWRGPALDTVFDKFNGSGTMLSQNYPLSSRLTAVPNEAEIGVNLNWTYTHVNSLGGVGSVTLDTYSAFKILAVPTGC